MTIHAIQLTGLGIVLLGSLALYLLRDKPTGKKCLICNARFEPSFYDLSECLFCEVCRDA